MTMMGLMKMLKTIWKKIKGDNEMTNITNPAIYVDYAPTHYGEHLMIECLLEPFKGIKFAYENIEFSDEEPDENGTVGLSFNLAFPEEYDHTEIMQNEDFNRFVQNVMLDIVIKSAEHAKGVLEDKDSED